MPRHCRLFAWLAPLVGLAFGVVPSPEALDAAPQYSPRPGASQRGVGVEALGERLYQRGLAADGRPLRARVQGDLEVSAADMPCVNCHRRSGWGTTEGSITTPPVAGRVLFEPIALGNPQVGVRTSGTGTRPAYDLVSLERLLRDGIDPSGRQLSLTMPRYEIGRADAAALAAYLRTMSAGPSPGVETDTLHLATISTPGANARQLEAVLSVLRRFTDEKNAETRYETRRRERGPWDMKAHYQLYRRWQLHEWTLEGSPATWRAQLDRLYAAHPVYAVVGGVSSGEWAPVHTFCEEAGIPCLFPQTPAPPSSASKEFYSIYFSPGVSVEAATLAAAAPELLQGGSLLQVTRCGGVGAMAAAAVTAALQGRAAVSTTCVSSDAELAAGAWARRLESRPTTVMAWLNAPDLQELSTPAGLGRLDGVERLVLSASLIGQDANAVPSILRPRSVWLNPAVAPDRFPAHAARSLVWLKRRGLAGIDDPSAVNALFAATLVADAVAMPRVLDSREYLVEQLEHMTGRVPLRSGYPATSLGPARRFASLGCAVERLPVEPGGRFVEVLPWTIPDIPAREER